LPDTVHPVAVTLVNHSWSDKRYWKVNHSEIATKASGYLAETTKEEELQQTMASLYNPK